MRLKKDEIELIKRVIKSMVKGEIYVFGSRIDDNKKGGDVDIYIIPDKNLSAKERLEILTEIKIKLEDKLFLPVDIVISKDKNRPIEKEAQKGIKIG